MTSQKSIEDRFADRDIWIFDLDNTLYPAHCNLFHQVDVRMGEFISSLLDVDRVDARKIQKTYYRDYGTTLRGLMAERGVDPRKFLDYVHDIDHSVIPVDAALGEAIAALPGRKLIFTNGSRRHAESVAGQIGILEYFEDIFDIVAADYLPKPHAETYRVFLDKFSFEGDRAAMFEDLSRNLKVPADLGMATVLVKPREGEHPDDRDGWVQPDEGGDHVHHVTSDLTGFLRDIVPARA
jgi:putative hydrolase of the HAD superfamily